MLRVAGIATNYKKRKKFLHRAINSLKDQVDQIIVYDNEQRPDITDLGKFYGLTLFDSPIYYFSCDDDLIYPKDYISQTIKHIDDYNCIITYHGRKIINPGENYYYKQLGYSFEKEINQTHFLDVAGTGVTGFRTDYFCPISILTSEYRRMSDLVFSLEARRQKKEIILPPHPSNWIIQQEVPLCQTITHTESKNPVIQNMLSIELWNIR